MSSIESCDIAGSQLPFRRVFLLLILGLGV